MHEWGGCLVEVVPPKPGISPVRWHPSRFCLSHSLPLHGDGVAVEVVRLNLHTWCCKGSRPTELAHLHHQQTQQTPDSLCTCHGGSGLKARLPACSRSPVIYLLYSHICHSVTCQHGIASWLPRAVWPNLCMALPRTTCTAPVPCLWTRNKDRRLA